MQALTNGLRKLSLLDKASAIFSHKKSPGKKSPGKNVFDLSDLHKAVPHDVFMHIFSPFLSQEQAKFSRVCKAWRVRLHDAHIRRVRYTELGRSPTFVTHNLLWHERVDGGFSPRFALPKCQKQYFLLPQEAKTDTWQICHIDPSQIVFTTSKNELFRLDITQRPAMFKQVEANSLACSESLPKAGNLKFEVLGGSCRVYCPFSTNPIAQIQVSGPVTFAHNGTTVVVSDTKNVALYSIEANSLALIWSKPIANFRILGITNEKLIGSIEKKEMIFESEKVVSITRNEIQVLNKQGESLYQIPNCNPQLTRLIGPALVVVDQNKLEIVDLEMAYKIIFSTQFDSNIRYYSINNTQLACVLENGALYYWHISGA